MIFSSRYFEQTAFFERNRFDPEACFPCCHRNHLLINDSCPDNFSIFTLLSQFLCQLWSNTCHWKCFIMEAFQQTTGSSFRPFKPIMSRRSSSLDGKFPISLDNYNAGQLMLPRQNDMIKS